MGKSILITGANGFVGSFLLEILSDTDWEIIPFVQIDTGLENEIIMDFCDPDFCKVINTLLKVDKIVHLGARIVLDNSPKSALFVPNVLATAELANWACKIGAHFIFASSAIVCGINTSHITSATPQNPDTNYGYSKWLAEEIIRMSGVKHTILRIAGIFGNNGPSHLGINRAIADALSGIVPLQYGDGKIRRNYIYVKDLGNIIKFCIENEVEGTHLVGGSSINTISEMLQIICDIFLPGKKPKYIEGKKNHDQIIEHSKHLPEGHSFEDAVRDIKNGLYERKA